MGGGTAALGSTKGDRESVALVRDTIRVCCYLAAFFRFPDDRLSTDL